MKKNSIVDLYHGSYEIVQEPRYGYGRADNDYGQGFYCTRDMELAQEWACNGKSAAWCNHYTLDLAGMDILDLTTEDFDSLQWLALLMSNREVSMDSQLMRRGAEWLIGNHLPEVSTCDVIVGYRADDSFFRIARAFVGNTLPLEVLEDALRSGELGLQYVMKSERAFDALVFQEAVPVDKRVYYPRRIARSEAANRKAFERSDTDGTFIMDIMRR